MPLFMDLHKASDYEVKPTVEEIKRNHIADLEVQHKHGVKFLQYWINEEAGLVFCLMEAPNKEACAAVHQEAHGNMPCNVIELKGGDYKSFMDEHARVNEFDIVENEDGTLDTGYRVILAADLLSITEEGFSQQNIDGIIKNCGGQCIIRPGTRKIIVFTNGDRAIDCAAKIMEAVSAMQGNNEIRIGISAGEPVTEQQDIFSDTIQLANRLCDIAQNGQVLISPLAKQLTNEVVNQPIKLINAEEEQFLNLLIEKTNLLLSEADFSIDSLCEQLSMSRSRLYRRITELTGYSASNFIQELRMQKALRLIRNKSGNVTQIAMEAGFSNPSYFSKSFQSRFGIAPFKALKQQP